MTKEGRVLGSGPTAQIWAGKNRRRHKFFVHHLFHQTIARLVTELERGGTRLRISLLFLLFLFWRSPFMGTNYLHTPLSFYSFLPNISQILCLSIRIHLRSVVLLWYYIINQVIHCSIRTCIEIIIELIEYLICLHYLSPTFNRQLLFVFIVLSRTRTVMPLW